RLIRCVCGKKIGPDPRNFNQRVSLGRNDLLIRTFLSYVVSDTETILDHIATLLSVASAVMLIVWAFKAKLALQAYALNEFKFELKMNPFYTFIFSIYYIVYCINDMESELQKHNVIYRKKIAD
ncbi:hypothetical protein OGY16_02825, partial [Citrobacter sp. Cpo131]|nr:hypothetical protein [Citrobacter sp. Cpo131]MDM2891412.1 hypothetical protein [Citrobacter sp. Cpo060]